MNEQMNRKIEQARRLAGQPVCVVLNDGSYYIGTIKGMRNGQLLLAGKKGEGRYRPPVRSRSKGKAQVSGLFSMLGGGAAGAGAGAAAGAAGGGFLSGLGGLGGIMGFMKQAWPILQMGMGVVKQIMPLMNMFKPK
ncbi:hypothetical protein [Cohnella sp. GCM10027633]|uniref:hypothetical protein n=1 Tax=unclassified Cohnella TaxID=2636738 RepID=UPI00362C8C38